MNCRTCNYALWNLKSRSCPECNTPFSISSYKFLPNSVRFCCPDCSQAYYGTDVNGQLQPASFNCVKCSRPLSTDEMVVLPAVGVSEAKTRLNVLPWLDKHNRGFFGRWFGTIGMAVGNPATLARSIVDDARCLPATTFAGLTVLASVFVSGVPVIVFPAFVGFAAAATPGGGGGQMFQMLATLGVGGIFVPLVFIAMLVLWVATCHGLLKLTGQTRGFGLTWCCTCYSSGVFVLAAIPCMGIWLSPLVLLWWAIVLAVVVCKAHGVSWWRGTLAAVVPPVAVMVLLSVSTWLLVVGPLRTTMAGAGVAMATPIQAAAAQGLGPALLQYAAGMNGNAADGRGPRHGAELLAEGLLTAADVFVGTGGVAVPPNAGGPAASVSSTIPPADSTIAGVDVLLLAGMNSEDQAEALDQLAATLPIGTIAHRLGDVVFTYHGIDLSPEGTDDGELWLAVVVNDSDIIIQRYMEGIQVNPPGTTPTARRIPNNMFGPGIMLYTAIKLDGATITFESNADKTMSATFKDALDKQNELRAAANLAPLPDPATVTTTSPAVAKPANPTGR